MKLHLLALSVSLCCGGSILAQEGGWTLEKCIQHALDNNLQIQQSELVGKRVNGLSPIITVSGSGIDRW